jgi:antirestriction protein ArdC
MENKIYQEVTDRIIANLEKGVIPWVKPWHTEK